MTFTITIGKYGGFYIHWSYTKRICLGWIALTFMPLDLDEFLDYLFNMAGGRAMSKWIKVEDRLPEQMGRYLTVDRYGVIDFCWFSNVRKWTFFDDKKRFLIVTHWISLPDSPEVSDE